MTTLHTLQNTVSSPVALWIDVPPPANPGCRSIYPFTLYLSAEDNSEHIVHLYAQNSGSIPYQEPQNKWSHLNPQWRFLDLSGNQISEITLPAGTAVSGQLYYVDDMPVSGCNPVLLWFIVDYTEYPVWYDQANCSSPVSGFSNSKVGFCVPYYINGVDPTNLDITRDGRNDLDTLYWRYAPIPAVVTLEDEYSTTICPICCENGGNFIHYIPESNILGLSGGTVFRTLTGVALSAQDWSPELSAAYLSALDENGFVVGGYLRGYVRSADTTTGTTITAAATVVYSPLYRHMIYFWVANPENSTLNRVYYPCVLSSLAIEATSYFEPEKTGVLPGAVFYNVPYIEQLLLDNLAMGLTGFNGLYGIAVDPCYNVYASDGEQDMLFKFNTQGTILTSIDIPNLDVDYQCPGLPSFSIVPLLSGIPLSPHKNEVLNIVHDDDGYMYVMSYTPKVAGLNDGGIEVWDTNTTPYTRLSYKRYVTGQLTGMNHQLFYYNKALYFKRNDNAVPGHWLEVVDVSNPLAPTSIQQVGWGADCQDLLVANDHIFYPWYDPAAGGRVMLNVYKINSNKTLSPVFVSLPLILGILPAPTNFRIGFNSKYNILFVSFRVGAGLQRFYLVDTPTTVPSVRPVITHGTNVGPFQEEDDYVYTSDSSSNLMVWDLSVPATPTIAYYPDNLFTGPFTKLKFARSGKHMAIKGNSDTMVYYTIDNPAQPTKVCTVPLYVGGPPNSVEDPKDILLDENTMTVFTGTMQLQLAYAYVFDNPLQGSTPAGISLDSQLNLWVGLFDASFSLKFDKDLNYLLGIDPGGNQNQYLLSSVGVDIDYKPTLVETDKNDDVWVSYTNTLCSFLYKYDTYGYGPCATITLPTCSNPMDLFVDYNNDLWVTLTYHSGPAYKLGYVRKYSGTTMVSSFSAVHPEYLTMDLRGNLWFTQDWNTVTKITTAGSMTHVLVGSTYPYVSADWITGGELLGYNALEGIAADVYNRVFVINSIENYVYEVVGVSAVPLVKINPDANLDWFNDTGVIVGSAIDPNIAKSAQAFGDWTGIRWLIKYTSMGVLQASSTVTAYLTGQSTPFSIEDYRGYDIRRFNESWNANNWVKDLYVQPHIHDNAVLWDGFMQADIGTDAQFPPNQGDGGGMYGRAAYERIANFVANHADINVSNIDQLYSLAQSTDVPIDDYGLLYPAELRRIMDIISINQQQLWGARCVCNKNIENEYKTVLSGVQIEVIAPSKPCCPETPSTIRTVNSGTYVPIESKCKRCGHTHAGNKGDPFDPLPYMVTAYHPFIIKDNYTGGQYNIVYPGPSCHSDITTYIPCCAQGTTISCISVYPLSASYNFVLPDIFNYSATATYEEFVQIAGAWCFFDYVDVPCGEQIAGVINWDDQYTTLDEHVSGINEWFGPGQTVEKILSYILHKGLGLLEDTD